MKSYSNRFDRRQSRMGGCWALVAALVAPAAMIALSANPQFAAGAAADKTDPAPSTPADKTAADKTAADKTAADKGAPSKGGSENGGAESDSVAATVNGASINRHEIEIGVRNVPGSSTISSADQPKLRAEVLASLIDRLLVEQLVKRTNMTVTDAQVAGAEKQIRLRLDQDKISFEAFLHAKGQTESEFRSRLSWQLLWEKFVQSKLSDAALQAFFNANHAEFDGTELRVSHILLRPAKSGDTEANKKLLVEAAELRKQIESGKLSFEVAASRYSAGPSREQGGDLGFIPRHGPMEDAFETAAFQLQPDEISKPVATSFGVHLIKVTEVKAGQKKWTDVRKELMGPMSHGMFMALAKQEREKAKIRIYPGVPHFKPGTHDLYIDD